MPIESVIEPGSKVSISRQCELVGLARPSYYAPKVEAVRRSTEEEEREMAAIDPIHLEHPCYGARRVSRDLRRKHGIDMKRRRVAGPMGAMGIQAVYPRPNASAPGKQYPKFPCLLGNKTIRFPNQAWSADITYIRMGNTHMYLGIVIDWFSRHITGRRLHDTFEARECVSCMEAAFEEHGLPAYVNSDQGSTYSSGEYIALLAGHGVEQSMDGKGRWVDNVFCERAFRTIRQECIYINEYLTPNELRALIGVYIDDYNNDRLHSALDCETPAEWYFSGIGSKGFALAA